MLRSSVRFRDPAFMKNNSHNVKIKRWRNRLACLKLAGAKCETCGLVATLENVAAFDFHHRDPKEKSFGMSSNYNRKSWQDLENEVKKCNLLCKNCHALEHEKAIDNEDFYRQVFEYDGPLDIWVWGHSPSIETILKVKKRKRLFQCVVCGDDFKPNNTNQKSCSVDCAKIARRKVERPTKEKLDMLLKEHSFCAIGRMFGVSDNAVRKWQKQFACVA